ncbi:MAG: acyl-[acyl-carrier-protein] desaturase [Actinomycetota bacterium]|jgi:acyl-[acyl-carrier-protein] desaturase|nr:acyl-[acyl-carrier-protein] desaturase [Actinomycetota bacterium]
MDTTQLLAALEPVVERLYERHLESAREWFPHELVPWDRVLGGDPREAWSEDQAPMPDGVRSALLVNLLTEDNLPHYFETINGMFGARGTWGEWTRRWTAEEGRHSIVIRDYLTVTRAVDPIALERGRMRQVSLAQVPRPATPAHGLAYVAIQELATRVSHGNTGRHVDDPVGAKVMARVAGDEQLHHVFYRDMVAAMLDIDPSQGVKAIADAVLDFEMPGTGIEGFGAHAKRIAAVGIYDFAVHADSILGPLLEEHWKLADITGLDSDASAARDKTLAHLDRVRKAGRRAADRRSANASAA